MKTTTTKITNNLKELLKVAADFAIDEKINYVIIFTKDGKAAIQLKELCGEKVSVLAATFPMNELMFTRDEEKIKSFKAETSKKEVKVGLENKGIKVIAGTMPLDNMIVPGGDNSINATIKNTLALFSDGMQLAVQGVLMATDHGDILPGERVLSVVSDTVIDVNATNSRLLFHPKFKMEINSIVAKVSNAPENKKDLD